MGAPTRLLVATTNPGKLVELRRILDVPGLVLVGLDTIDPRPPEVDEDGVTFEQNAEKKARELAVRTGLFTLADDSGLEVDALGGAPGVHSARYSGGGAEANVRKLLDALRDVPAPARTARFRCVIALADPGGPLGEGVALFRGVFEGSIGDAARGGGGFGYDPVFVPVGETRTVSELPDAEKDRLSHRGRACAALRPFLERYVGLRDAP